MKDLHIREAFWRPPVIPATVTSGGFRLGGEVAALLGPVDVSELEGRITRITLRRKLSRNSVVLCSSPDGIEALNGTRCQECLHPHCRPMVRVRLSSGPLVFLFDLQRPSVWNLFRLQDDAERKGQELVDWRLRLRVVAGVVRFERLGALRGGADERQRA